jgi:hypothetical protein
MMSDLLLAKIAKTLQQSLVIKSPFVLSVTYSASAMTKDKFYKQLGTYLPLAYQDYLERLQEKTTLPVWKIWCNMYKEECDTMVLAETRSDKDYANERRDFMIGRTTIFTDILRSTFFRVVDYLKEAWVIKTNDLFYYTLKNFQVDTSFWEIPLFKKPNWWPRFKQIPEVKSDLNSIELREPLEKIIFANTDEQILHMSGAISPVKRHYEDVLEGTIHLLPFAFISGSRLPDGKSIYEAMTTQSGHWFPEVHRNPKPYCDRRYRNRSTCK